MRGAIGMLAIALVGTGCSTERGPSIAPDPEDSSEYGPIPTDRYASPNVAGRRFRIEGRPGIDAAVFGQRRAYRNELAGTVLQTGTYAITPDNQLCFQFDKIAGNPCFFLRPVEGETSVYALGPVGGEPVARLIDIGPSDLDG